MKIITMIVADDIQPKLFKAIADSGLELEELSITTPKPPRVRTKKGEPSGSQGTPSPKS